ncbi:MAG TPA: energy transducer TonB [Rhizomicrobium sp.]|nr:energy transducer TonB [Rhizomicrobium sp.]
MGIQFCRTRDAVIAAVFGTTILLSTAALAQYDKPRLDPAYPNYQPAYPDTAQVNGEQGDVVLNLKISASGRVRGVQVVQSSGFEDLDNAAVAGVLRWRYLPSDNSSELDGVKIAYRLPTAIVVPPKGSSASRQ